MPPFSEADLFARLPDLPIREALPALLTALERANVAVLEAPPGAGKTTVVPLALLAAPWREGGKIIVLEPRRLAARAAATRMAALLGEAVGQTVGYRVRLENRVSAATRVEVVTEGILTRLLQDDPALEGVAAILFDEYHERSLQADLGLALALDAQAVLRPDLRLLVMSATLDSARLGQWLGAVVVRSEGRMFPVETTYATPAEVSAAGPYPAARLAALAPAAVTRALRQHPAGDLLVFLPGLADQRRVADKLEPALTAIGTIDLHVLHGELPLEQQDAALRPAPAGRRKVVLATSIAETSLTIEGVRIVIDGGFARVPRYDPRTGLSTLATEAVSQAAADQRRGRAGRLGPGWCYRLWPQADQAHLTPFAAPEIRGADLSALALETAIWGTPAEELRWLDPPTPAALRPARELLARLGAITNYELRITEDELGKAALATPLAAPEYSITNHGLRITEKAKEYVEVTDGQSPPAEAPTLSDTVGKDDNSHHLPHPPHPPHPSHSLHPPHPTVRNSKFVIRNSTPTPHGRELVRLGLTPRLGHLVLRGRAAGFGATAAALAALLAERDLLTAPGGSSGSGSGAAHSRFQINPDLRLRLESLATGRAPLPGLTVDAGAAHRVRDAATALARRAGIGTSGPDARLQPDAAGLLTALAYPDRLAQREAPGRLRLLTGQRATVADDHFSPSDQFFAVAHLDGGGGGGGTQLPRAALLAPLTLAEIEAEFGPLIETADEVRFDAATGRVWARRRRRLGALILSDVALPNPAPALVAAALLDGLRAGGIGRLPWSDEAAHLRTRLAFLHHLAPARWPDVSDTALLETLPDWLGPHLPPGARSLDALSRVDFGEALLTLLPDGWPQRQELDRLAPSHLPVPSGSRIRLDYTDPATPVLAVRLQEVFGLLDTPTIGGVPVGTVPLLLHLLSPGHRPVQVTRDLRSFWQTGYFAVRKDLRGRYPKHHWPDNPLEAAPTARAKPRGT